MDFTEIIELKKNIETYYINKKNDNDFEEFKKMMIKKFNKIDITIINNLCNINKFDVDKYNDTNSKLYIPIELLKNEVINFYKSKKNKQVFIEQVNIWINKYKYLFMKSDKLFIGLVNRTLEYEILNQIIYNMKQVDKGNITKTKSDVEMGQILYKKYINLKE